MENSKIAWPEDFSAEDDLEAQETILAAADGEFARLLEKLKADAVPKEG